MRSVTFDDFFLIMGNYELRIKFQDNKLYSNFGLNSGYFASKGKTVNILLGEVLVREVLMEDYEVHEVIFK